MTIAELGIDQGPIVIMIETIGPSVPGSFHADAEIQRGLRKRALFRPWMALSIESLPAQNAFTMTWSASAGSTYQVEYSNDLLSGSPHQMGKSSHRSTASWTDNAPLDSQRFYRVSIRISHEKSKRHARDLLDRHQQVPGLRSSSRAMADERAGVKPAPWFFSKLIQSSSGTSH